MNAKARNVEQPFPGCLGRMVNLFDLSTSVAGGNRLLTDKPHRDGSPLSRSRSDVSGMSPIADHSEDKVIVSELRRTSSNKKSDGTPIKMLIAQEMLKEVESKHNPPGVVAKLMGLDSLPCQQLDPASRRSHSRGGSRSHSEIPSGHWHQEDFFLDTQLQHEIRQYPEKNEYKDVYEIWHQSPKTNLMREKSPQKGRCKEITNEKKMSLIRQKFVEAKRLATDEKLRQSKQFQDALEVLSSNKDLFLQFLQEPNSLFSQHLYNLQSIPPPPETKRITVLRPSKAVDHNKFAGIGKKNEKQIKKTSQGDYVNRWDKSNPNAGFSPPSACCNLDDSPAQPTRIVVLKPTLAKPNDIKAVVSPPSSSSLRTLHDEEFYAEREDDEVSGSREATEEIKQQMSENFSGLRRDETLLSSVFSNGYIGDESSFNKSEIEYTAENLSDSEIMSPVSRHSWDYINKFGSPYSSSSFSRASYSPESSVCREAKKRLSERWAMMASNSSSQEQRHVRRSSSTLGEMLALTDMKKSVNSAEDGINKEQESKGSTLCLTSDLNKDESVDNSPKNLLRSKSVPVSSTVNGSRLNVEVSEPELNKIAVPKELAKAKSAKSSFKGKVSSLFFSRNKKSIKEKASQSSDEPQSAEIPIQSSGKIGDDRSQCVNNTGLEEGLSPGLQGSCTPSSPDSIGLGRKQCIISSKAGFSGNPIENPEQPSPISVLEPPFEEDDHSSGTNLLIHPVQSNLIDKSPPIGSIARSLAWDDSCVEAAIPYAFNKIHTVGSTGGTDEEQEWFFFAETLLSAAGLNGEVQPGSFLARWHSPESPLDPSLRDTYIDPNDKETVHEARRRQQRSTRKLVFDCVNAALVDIAGYGPEACQRSIPCSGAQIRINDHGGSSIMVDQVWARMKEWFCGEVRFEGGDNNSLVVERVVRKEVVGKGWVEHLRLEIDNLG